LKIACNELAKPIAFIINDSIRNGIVPDILEISRITPIFKAGEKNNPSNYRPIPILPSINKILEIIIYEQLLLYLDKHNILNKFQFVFRKIHSN
jgi:hypothetical protein